ncbi:MAG: GNAT family N-acetyltransferase [Treponema sp.]|nr:GNAT family N-acetyltransferase [Treponema sp.]
MQFELTEALLDDILFSMEDQDGVFYIDTQEGVVITEWDSGELVEEEGRLIDLPHWDSSSGFRLMERFATTIRNPLIRNELSSALNQGRGVFRAFKNTLSQHPEAEKLWFSFKEREMKREIVDWYNALREEWGLERIGFEPEETSDLILEDFRFREFRDEDTLNISDKTPAQTDAIRFIAESGDGEFAGYIAAERKNETLFIRALEIIPQYRGLGIGKTLLDYFLNKIKPLGIIEVNIELPVEAEWFSRALIREGFTPRLTKYSLSLNK